MQVPNFLKDWKKKFNRQAILAELYKTTKINEGNPYCFQELPPQIQDP